MKVTITYHRMQNASDDCKARFDAYTKAQDAVKKARDALVAEWKQTPVGQATTALSANFSFSEDGNGLTFTPQAFYEPNKPVTQSYLGESTMNLLLNSKLLSEAEKKALLAKQFPAIFPANEVES